MSENQLETTSLGNAADQHGPPSDRGAENGSTETLQVPASPPVSSNAENTTTTSEGEEDPVRSPLNQMFQEISERQREAMEKMLHGVVDTSCLTNCGSKRLEDQMDLFMHCRQPLSFFRFLEENDDDESTQSIPYLGPRSCEYCGSSTTSLCPASCQRPKLYFRKRRPPFCKMEGWDPVTEYALPEETKVDEQTHDIVEGTERHDSWMTGFFRGVSGTSLGGGR